MCEYVARLACKQEGIAWQEEDNPSLDALRSIRYDFNVDVLRLPTISTQYVSCLCHHSSPFFNRVWCRVSLTFAVGPTPVPKFRMIERHYFRNTLVKSYDFEFGFCIPNSTNTWEAVYDMPPLEDALGAPLLAFLCAMWSRKHLFVCLQWRPWWLTRTRRHQTASTLRVGSSLCTTRLPTVIT